MIYDYSDIASAVADQYPTAEISYYWSQDDLTAYLCGIASALSACSRHVLTLNTGGRTIVLSLNFSGDRKCIISRLIEGVPVNRIDFYASDFFSESAEDFVSDYLSLIESVV